VLNRWVAGDSRVPGAEPDGRDPTGLLAAARVAYEAGRLASGIRFGTLALDAAAAHGLPAWGIAPWIYPPAFDSLFGRLPEAAPADSIDRALMQALVWQESRFDAAARSRSNALGLTQLKLATASDVARWLRDPRPTAAGLRQPGRNLRYGTRYLEYLFGRFGRVRSVALAAYNGGPGRVTPRWRELLDRGGEALFADLVPYLETRDYVRRIVGVRQAYRELRPGSSPPAGSSP
jgi:soluble lytic murein transglycosylase